MKLEIRSIAGEEVLAGALLGKRVLGSLLERMPRAAEPIRVYLDFTGIEVATGSFLREAVIRFRDFCRKEEFLYPIVANANDKVLEELELLARADSDVLVTCDLQGDEPSNGRVLGPLEAKQQMTLDTVRSEGEADAVLLSKKHRDQKVKSTAWNNRLSWLANKGVLLEIRKGRLKRYRTVLERL